MRCHARYVSEYDESVLLMLQVHARYELTLQTQSRSFRHAAWLQVKSLKASGQYTPDVCLSSRGVQAFGDPELNRYSTSTVTMGQEAVGDTLTPAFYFVSSVFSGMEASELDGFSMQVPQWQLQLTPLAEALNERRTMRCKSSKVNFLSGMPPLQTM
jgi:hypothetical protein